MDLKNQTQKRTIKFRGKNLKGQWHYGLLCHDKTKDSDYEWFISNSAGKPYAFGAIPETIGQFTGLLDINGKEIYEGDIVRWGMHGGSWGHETWNRYAVVEINPDLQFRIIHYIHFETYDKRPSDNFIFRFGQFAYKETEKYLEIIGNIHENPELLNQTK